MLQGKRDSGMKTFACAHGTPRRVRTRDVLGSTQIAPISDCRAELSRGPEYRVPQPSHTPLKMRLLLDECPYGVICIIIDVICFCFDRRRSYSLLNPVVRMLVKVRFVGHAVYRLKYVSGVLTLLCSK